MQDTSDRNYQNQRLRSAAQDLIKERKYSLARHVLAMTVDDPLARQMLNKLPDFDTANAQNK